METIKPRTLGEILKESPENLIGITFQSGDWVYDIDNVWSDIKTKGLCLSVGTCDLGEYGAAGSDVLNLHYSTGFLDCEELIEGVNAEKCCPLTYYPSAI